MFKTITLQSGESIEEKLPKRSGAIDEETLQTVAGIIAQVRARGDEALHEYTMKFDKVDLEDFRLPAEMVEKSRKDTDPAVLQALEYARKNIDAYQREQVPTSTFQVREDGSMIGSKITPLDTVGFYVPGGRAQYPSTVLMNVIPAKVAGVRRIVMCTPPSSTGSIDQTTLAAASMAGVDEVYAVGGAQAIAAMAYGTQTIPRCDKVVGPGNIFVAAAKKLVDGDCGIDSIAGPSEVLILADDTAEPAFVAADMMAQAEHDPNAAAFLVTDDPTLPEQVAVEIERLMKDAPRAEIITASLDENGLAVVCPDEHTAIEVANTIAPEHLEIQMDEPFDLLGQVRCAGAIFIGPWSVEAVGDYVAGPSHTLPTSGTARFSGPLSAATFVKSTSIISYSYPALAGCADTIETIAAEEGLDAHAASVRERISFVESAE